ncbi:MAG: hypothetical protein QQN53_07355 [Nitrosopumilus sp.]
MQSDEKIQAHLVSIWRESKRFFAIGGKEGMLILTDRHLMFVHKTESMMKWWKAITQRQVMNFLRSKNTMIRHDGYDEEELMNDLENKKILDYGCGTGFMADLFSKKSNFVSYFGHANILLF